MKLRIETSVWNVRWNFKTVIFGIKKRDAFIYSFVAPHLLWSCNMLGTIKGRRRARPQNTSRLINRRQTFAWSQSSQMRRFLFSSFSLQVPPRVQDLCPRCYYANTFVLYLTGLGKVCSFVKIFLFESIFDRRQKM